MRKYLIIFKHGFIREIGYEKIIFKHRKLEKGIRKSRLKNIEKN